MIRSIHRLNSVCITAWIDSLRMLTHLQALMSNLTSVYTSEDVWPHNIFGPRKTGVCLLSTCIYYITFVLFFLS